MFVDLTQHGTVRIIHECVNRGPILPNSYIISYIFPPPHHFIPTSDTLTIFSSHLTTYVFLPTILFSLLTPIPMHHHVTQWAILNHHSHYLKQRIRRRHSRQFGIGIVSRRHLYEISGYEIDAFEAAEDGTEFAGGPAACFGGASCGGDYGGYTLALRYVTGRDGWVGG